MKRNMIDTSLQAYDTIKPHIGTKQQQVLDALVSLKGNATNQEIANHLGWALHKVTPRTCELAAMDLIERGERAEKAWKYVFVKKEVQLKLEMV